MRLFTTLILAICTCAAPADEADVLKLHAPEGWSGETISLPPGFAKDMSFKGKEHIRFAPGMMKAGSETFFCYAFVFELNKDTTLTPKTIRQELLSYYRGLCTAVMNGKQPELAPSSFTLTLKPAKRAAGSTPLVDNEAHYAAELKWVEPFATGKTQTLHLEILTGTTANHQILFACVAPQKQDAPIWKSLRKIRDDYLNRHQPRKATTERE